MQDNTIDQLENKMRRAVLSFDYSSLNDCNLQTSIGHTLKPLQCAVYGLKQAVQGRGYATILIDIIREGGDADTNCAVAGAALGAFFGKAGIPQIYVDGLVYRHVLDQLVTSYLAINSQ
jgi:ADP-ribosylglycohydrolase